MIQFNPGEYIPLDYDLGDPTDTDTHYVRAYVRKRKGSTDELLATLNMDDQGSQRFTYSYLTPQDSDPYFLIISYRVFDDATYLTESARYVRSQEKFLVEQRGEPYLGGGGIKIDYEKIKKMIQEEIKNIPQPEKIDLTPLLTALLDVNRNIRGIKIPEYPKIDIPKPEKIDFSGVIKAVESVQKEVRAIDIPKTDLSPVLVSLENFVAEILRQIGVVSLQSKTDILKRFEEFNKGIKTIDFIRLKNPETIAPEKKRKLAI